MEINFSNNKIEEISNRIFYELVNLKSIDFSNNKIKQLNKLTSRKNMKKLMMMALAMYVPWLSTMFSQ